MSEQKVCDGDSPMDDPDNYRMVMCKGCLRSVLEEYADDPFWGFQNCDRKTTTNGGDDETL